MPILTHHWQLQDQAASGNKSIKMPINFTDKTNTKSLVPMPTAEKQTAGKLGSLSAKDFPSSCITDHQDSNDSQSSFRDFTVGLKTQVPDDHTWDSDDHSLWSHKFVKRKHDASSEHENMTSNLAKQKQLFLTLTQFDEDFGEDHNEDDLNDTSYHGKDDDSDDKDDDDGLKYLGMEPRAKRLAESVDSTCQYQWDLDSSCIKDAQKGLFKVPRIKPVGLLDQKRDCTALLVQILKQVNIKNIFLTGSDVPEDLSLHKLWHKAWVTGLAFIHFHPHGENLSDSSMGIQRIHNPPALRCRQVKDDKMPRSFCPWCCKYGGNTNTIASHIQQDHYKLGVVCPQCKSHISTCHEDLKSHIIQCRKGRNQRVARKIVPGVLAPFLQISSHSITDMVFHILSAVSPIEKTCANLSPSMQALGSHYKCSDFHLTFQFHSMHFYLIFVVQALFSM